MTVFDEIRQYCLEQCVQPARKSGQRFVEIRSGDVHRAPGLRSRYSQVCTALGSRKFEDLASVERVSIEGPLHGANTVFTFRVQ